MYRVKSTQTHDAILLNQNVFVNNDDDIVTEPSMNTDNKTHIEKKNMKNMLRAIKMKQ